MKLMRNLAVAQFKLRQYDTALHSFETSMAVEPNIRVGFSIIICHCCLGHQPQQLQDAFTDLLGVELEVMLLRILK